MNVTVKNIAKRAIVVPGVGELALLEGLVAPGDSVVVDESLTKTDFIRHLVRKGELVITGVVIEPEPENDELTALREQADMLGIQHNKRWGVVKFREEIAKLTDSE